MVDFDFHVLHVEAAFEVWLENRRHIKCNQLDIAKWFELIRVIWGELQMGSTDGIVFL